MPKLSERILKAVAFGLLAGAVIVFAIGYAGLATHYFYTNPHAPDPATGRMQPYNYHGIVIYLSSAEQQRLDFFAYLPFVMFGTGALIAIIRFKAIRF